MATTIQQLLDAWDIELFSKESDDEFVRLCAEREQFLKSFLNRCWFEIMQHAEMPSLSENQLTTWRKNKIKKNEKNFHLYLDELVGELDKNKIELYISKNKNDKTIPFKPDVLLLTYCSYYGTVLTDIFWIGDLTVAHIIQISKRELDLNILGKYVDGQIDKIKNLIARHNTVYASHSLPFSKLEEAFACHRKRLYTGFNLILITLIEGIVRSFGQYLIEKQKGKPGKTGHSMDSFLKNTSWAVDLEIDKLDYYSITGDYNYGEWRPDSIGLCVPKTVKVSYQTRLDFLSRGFKEKRNSLAHGDQVEYEDTLQALINTAALVEVLETIIQYSKVY